MSLALLRCHGTKRLPQTQQLPQWRLRRLVMLARLQLQQLQQQIPQASRCQLWLNLPGLQYCVALALACMRAPAHCLAWACG